MGIIILSGKNSSQWEKSFPVHRKLPRTQWEGSFMWKEKQWISKDRMSNVKITKLQGLGCFASKASGPQKTKNFDLVGKNGTSTGKRNNFER